MNNLLQMIKILLINVFLLSVFSSCGIDFKEAGDLGDIPEIITIKASPPDVSQGESTTLESLVYWPDENLKYLWLRCVPADFDQASTCVPNQMENMNSFPGACSDDSTALCVISEEATGLLSIPTGLSLPENAPFIYSQLIVTNQDDIEASCFKAAKSGVSTSSCLIGVKRVLSTTLPFKNVNPKIAAVLVDDATYVDNMVLDEGEHTITAKVDPLTVNEVFNPDSEKYYIKVYWYTDCGSLKGVIDDTHPFPQPYRGSMTCILENNQASCSDIKNIITINSEKPDNCSMYIVFSDQIGGIDYKILSF